MQKIFEELEKKFKIENIVNEKTEIIFLLESPHKKELEFGYPVSGPSGKTMTKVIFNGEYEKPLGLVLKDLYEKKIQNDLAEKIGLMNVCQIPMQRIAYPEDIQQKYSDFFNHIEELRNKYHKTNFKQKEVNIIRNIILKKFNEELTKLNHEKVILIPCGKIASTFLSFTSIEKQLKLIKEIPHPSYNSWNKQAYAEVIAEMMKKINKSR